MKALLWTGAHLFLGGSCQGTARIVSIYGSPHLIQHRVSTLIHLLATLPVWKIYRTIYLCLGLSRWKYCNSVYSMGKSPAVSVKARKTGVNVITWNRCVYHPFFSHTVML